MAEVSYDVFLPEVLPYVPNCSEPQATNAIRNACIEFCKFTNFLQQDIDPISVQANVSTYDVDVPTNYVLGTILSLYWDGLYLPRKSQAELEKMFGMNWQTIDTGVPRYFTQFDPDTFTTCLTPVENLSGGFTGRLSFYPSRDSSQIDGLIFERFAEDIAAGALARLLRTPNEPYTDMQASMAYMSKFRTAMQNAASYVKGGMAKAPLRVYQKRLV